MSVHGPWQIAAIGFFASTKLGEADGLFVRAEFVRIHDTARQDQRVELLRVRILDGHVDFDAIGFVVVLPALDLAQLG